MRKSGISLALQTGVAGLALTVTIGISAPAYAQDAQEEGASTGGEIVVTAQRREEKAKDVPISLTAISAERLDQGDVSDLSDVAKLTPALRFDNQGGFAQPTIRGVGTAVSASGSGSNVGIYVDGYYAPNPLTADFQLLNVAGVTVLKGPQGTLFGRNTTGGAIQVTTRDPSTTPSLVAQFSYGSFNTVKAQAYGTTGIGDSVAIDLAGLYSHGDGFIHNIVTGSNTDGSYDNWSIRAGLKFFLGDSNSILLRYTHSTVVDPTSLATNAYVDPATGRILSQGDALLDLGLTGIVTATKPNEVSNTSRTYFDSTVDAFTGTGNFDLGFATLTSYTQYRKEQSTSFLDLDSSSVPIFDVDFHITDEIFTQEFLLNSAGDGPFKWTLGAFYFWDKNRFTGLNGYFSGSFAGLISQSQTDSESFAAYADGTYQLTDQFFLTAGLRYSNEKVKNGGYFIGPLAAALGLLAPPNVAGFNAIPEVSYDKIDPRVVLRYKPSAASSIYASYSQGHKAPILNPNGFTKVPVNAEKISAYELGYKYAANGLSFDISGYYYDYKDLQVASYNGTQSLITNAATSRVYGLESQLSYRVSDNFEFNVGAAWLDAKYKTFKTSPIFIQCLDITVCDPLLGAYGAFPAGINDSSGYRMQRSPEFTGNIGGRYTTDLAGGQFALSGTLAYTSGFYFDTSQQFYQKGYELLSLRAEWTDPSEHITLAVYGDNVTNAKYRNQVLAGATGIQSVWGYPATIGASIRFKY